MWARKHCRAADTAHTHTHTDGQCVCVYNSCIRIDLHERTHSTWISTKRWFHSRRALCVCVCVFYLRLCVDVGAVSDELLHHVCLAGEGSYVEGCVSFLLFKKNQKKHFTLWNGGDGLWRVCHTGLFHLSTLAVAAAVAIWRPAHGNHKNEELEVRLSRCERDAEPLMEAPVACVSASAAQQLLVETPDTHFPHSWVWTPAAARFPLQLHDSYRSCRLLSDIS